ncbi:nuclear transport factor 2 family protein [Kitasatospora sp. NPDC001664]
MTHHLARRIERAFDTLDRAAADALCAPHYREHGAVTDPGPADRLGAVLTGLPPDFRYGLELTLCEGELLVLVGVCEGLPGGPLGAVDLFRVHDGLLVEHWDALGALPERPFAPLHLRRYEIPAPDSHRRLTERALALLGAEGEFAYAERLCGRFGAHGYGPRQLRTGTRRLERTVTDGDQVLLQSTLATATGPRTEYRLYDLGREDAPTCWRLTAPQVPVSGVSGVPAVPHGDLRPHPDAVLTH